MLRKIFILAIVAAVAFTANAQLLKATDNIYGDYMISSSTKLISLDLEGAALLNVVKLLSQQTGFNFVANQGRCMLSYLVSG